MTSARSGKNVEPGDIARLYKAPESPELVTVPPLTFLMIDGRGDPNTAAEYQDAVAALYALSYALKFALKKTRGLAYRVGPLEGLWWSDDMAEFSVERKDDWNWTMMIGQPDAVTADWFDRIRQDVGRKKALATLPHARLQRFDEGLSAQVLHVGPFSAEGPTITLLHEFISSQGYGMRQKHHEIYLSDPRRTAPEKWKTIIRQPVVAADA